jgi:nicotinamidase-related amidase
VVTQPSTQRPFAETSWIAEPPQHSALGWFPCLIPDDTIVAAGVDGFFDSSLESVLRRRRIERVIFVGVGLETSVHSTMRSANDRGYECLLVLDACVAYDQQMLAPAVSMIEMSGGIFGAVGYSPAFVAGFRSREKVFS